MRAFVLPGFDRAPEFADVPEPAVGEHDVLVRVQATSVNPVDRFVVQGFFAAAQEYRFPAVFGRDVAGVVERVGPAVTRYTPGDRVFGFVKRDHIGDGTFAELVAVPEDLFVAPVPQEVSTRDAGVLGLAGVTALECVESVGAGPGRTVLVNAAAGGVGTFAVQLAVAAGATVVASGRPGPQAEYLRGLGATHVVDWTTGNLTEQVRSAAPDGVDGVVDLGRHVASRRMGENESASHEFFASLCRAVLRPGGRAASVTNGGVTELMPELAFENVHSTPSPASFARLAGLVASGAVVVPVAHEYGFDDLPTAFEQLAAGGVLGKIAVRGPE